MSTARVAVVVLALLALATAVSGHGAADSLSAGAQKQKIWKWKERRVESVAQFIKKKADEWHTSDHDESLMVKEIVKVINLGVRTGTWTYLDTLFSKLEQVHYKGTFSYSNLYGRIFKDRNIFDVKENIDNLVLARDQYAPHYRGYNGMAGTSFWKVLAEDVTTGAARDRIFIASKGMVKGAWAGIKGLWTMVTSPIQTAKGMYTMVVEYDKTDAALRKLVKEYIDAAKNDPNKFADMTGQLSGQIMVSLVSPAKVLKGKDALNVLKTVGNTLRINSKLYHYTGAKVMPLIKNSNKLIHGKHAKGVFATTVPPSLLFGSSLFSMLARAAVLGGRLDFFFKAGRMIRLGRFKVPMPIGMTIKPPFTHAVQFMDKGMKLAVKTNLEAKMALACKSLFLQYGKKGNVALGAGTKFITAASMKPTVMEALFNGLGYVVVPVAMADHAMNKDQRFRQIGVLSRMRFAAASVSGPETKAQREARAKYDCSNPKVKCALDRLKDADLAAQEREFGTNPYGDLYSAHNLPGLDKVMKDLTCCDDPKGDCCGLA